jgi:hypothetical protein
MHYLASPYSHPDPDVVLSRFNDTSRAAAHLASLSIYIISPILHWHHTALTHTLPTSHCYWRTYNHSLILRCDSIIFLTLDGWQASSGIADELTFARSENISYSFITLDALLLLSAAEAHKL